MFIYEVPGGRAIFTRRDEDGCPCTALVSSKCARIRDRQQFNTPNSCGFPTHACKQKIIQHCLSQAPLVLHFANCGWEASTLYGIPKIQEHSADASETYSDQLTEPASSLKLRICFNLQEPPVHVPDTPNISSDACPLLIADATKETDTISNCSQRNKNILKNVKQPGSSGKAEDMDNVMVVSLGVYNETNEVGTASFVSVDAPNHHEVSQLSNAPNQNIEEVNSCHDFESRITASISSNTKFDLETIVKEFECTADSKRRGADVAGPPTAVSDEEVMGKRRKEKKDKKKKRKREEKCGGDDCSNDPKYLERKRQKEEKRRLEKELAKRKQKVDGREGDSSVKLLEESSSGDPCSEGLKKLLGNVEEPVLKPREPASVPRLKIKIKRTG